MNITVILEVAIGLVVVWFVLSLATIQFQEIIANAFKFRSKDLEKAIGQMLSSKTLVDEFYKHPLIQGLMEKPDKKPSYVPAREFALTVFNIITTAGTEQSVIQQGLGNFKKTNLGQVKGFFKQLGANRAFNDLIKETKDKNLTLSEVSKKLDELAKDYKEVAEGVEELKGTLTSYVQSIKNLPDPDKFELQDIKLALNAIEKIYPDLARAMRSLVAGAESFVVEGESALAEARTSLETWFNNSMDRLTGWYKRRSQVIAFFIGLALAIFLNIDSVAIAKKLWIDPTMRAAILEIAPTLEAPPAATSADTTNTETPAEAPDAATQTEAGGSEPEAQQPTAKTPEEILSETRSLLDQVGLPVGWVPATLKLPEEEMMYQKGDELVKKEVICKPFPPKPTDTTLPVQGFLVNGICYRPFESGIIESANLQKEENWLLAWIIGVLISGVATIQGAPFWFDLLSKFINIRGAGVKPPAETSATNASG